jgi:hypothetical protein
MSNEEKPQPQDQEPENVFKKLVWRSVLRLSWSMEQYTTWTITGIAAIIGLFISHLDSVSKIVSVSGLRWGLILFTLALLFGVISKQIGMAVTSGLETIAKLESFLYSSDGQHLLASMTIDPKKLVHDLADPFLWPLSRMMRTGGIRGTQDLLSSDKRFVRMFCVQLYFVWLHGLCSIGAIAVIALSIRQ